MGITDARLVLADQAIIGPSATVFTQQAATNTIDLGAKDLDVGAGTPLYLNIRITTAPSAWRTTGDTTCSWVLQGCDTLSVPNTGPAYNISKQRAGVTLAAGWRMRQALPTGIKSKHLRLKFVTGAATAMTFAAAGGGLYDAWISPATPETDVGT